MDLQNSKMRNQCNYLLAGLFLVFAYSCTPQISDSNSCPNFARKKGAKEPTGLDSVFAVVDTVEIADPIVILFKQSAEDANLYRQTVLVAKSSLDSSMNYTGTSYRDFICKQGYVFLTDIRSSCLVNNLHVEFPALENIPFYAKLQNDLRNAEKDTVWVADSNGNVNTEKYLGLEYGDIYSKKFLLCSVKGRILRRCQDLYTILIPNMDEMYFKVAIPFPNQRKM